MKRDHDLGYLKRRDRSNGWSDLLGGNDEVIATVRTDAIAPRSQNLRRFRIRLTEHLGA